MLAVRLRSGLEETHHEGAVAVSRADGTLVAWSGEIERPFFIRSAGKPFQAHVVQESGAGLSPTELALAAASHSGFPVHVALVESLLGRFGLDETDLRCPPGWPMHVVARDRLVRAGEPWPRRIWHPCSGKHAGFLAACVVTGWPSESYLDPGHPLQRRVIEAVSELGDSEVEPVGVDGCGAPVLRTTVRALSLLFARLGAYPEFTEVFTAMHRYPALVSSNGVGDAAIATATHAAAKGGALGCMGVGLKGGLGVGVKSWDGSSEVADVAAIATLGQLGSLPAPAAGFLESLARPIQYGGGSPQGHLETRLQLRFT